MSAAEIGFEFTDEKTRLGDLSPLYRQWSQVEQSCIRGARPDQCPSLADPEPVDFPEQSRWASQTLCAS